MPSYELNLDLPDTEALSLFKTDAQEVTAKQSKTMEQSVCAVHLVGSGATQPKTQK